MVPLAAETKSAVDYIFEPTEEEIIQELIPKSIKLSIFRSLLESNASEHGARMAAMDKSTNNAGEVINKLTLTMNKIRQASITNQIIEIVSGANA